MFIVAQTGMTLDYRGPDLKGGDSGGNKSSISNDLKSARATGIVRVTHSEIICECSGGGGGNVVEWLCVS